MRFRQRMSFDAPENFKSSLFQPKSSVMIFEMVTQSPTPFDLLLDPVAKCLTPEVAQQLAEIRLDDTTRSRISELAEKANEGLLTDLERAEYEEFVEALDLLAILQLKAREVVAGHAR